MPLFGNRPPPPTEGELRAAEIDLERIRQGGIPAGAEQRLKRIAAASEPFFTSDLSSKEYALAQASGLRPLAQVMGSSVVQHGWGMNQAGLYSSSSEIKVLSDPWNMARERCFGRLAQEAELAGADGVIGIELSAQGRGDIPGAIEYVVFGTAVRDTVFPRGPRDPLGVCTLTGQEVDKLRRIGARICGVVGYTTVVGVQLSYASNYVMNSSGWLGRAGNQEIREVTQGVYEARRRAMNTVRQQANAVGANNLVISTLNHTIEHLAGDGGAGSFHYFYVTMHVLGTAIRMGAHDPHPPNTPEPMISINLGDQPS